MTQQASQFDIFISYQWNIKEKVLKLYEIISSTITPLIWLDKFELIGDHAFEELKKGIDNSRLVI